MLSDTLKGTERINGIPRNNDSKLRFGADALKHMRTPGNTPKGTEKIGEKPGRE